MRSELRPLAVLLGGQLVAGVAIGLIWLWWAPRTVSYLIPAAPTGAATVVIPDESESQVAGDGRFFALCLVIGLLTGLLGWVLLRRQRGPLTLVTMAFGGLASSLVALGVGHGLSHGTRHPAIQTAYHPALTLHSPSFLAIQTLFAVAVYSVFAGMATDPAFTGSVLESADPSKLGHAGPPPTGEDAVAGV
jgi:hypothetical protein